jgi:uncharacterized protein YndB with AHSA1/START domain
MTMDFSKACGATFREVAKSERNGKPTRVVLASRSYSTGQKDLWNAISDKKRISLWFAEVSGDFESGGQYAIKDNAKGEITACEAPKMLALTWVFGDNISWVKVTVEEDKNGATLTLEHESPTDAESEAHWAQYGPGATGVGWEMAFLGLDVHIANEGQPSREMGEKWLQTKQGKMTLLDWAEAWGAAHIRAGADTENAMCAAEQTGSFYTGEA